MDVVLPLLARDVERYLRLQRPTFERFYADLGTTWILARSEELATLRQRCAALEAVRVVDENSLVPELKLVRVLGRGGESIGWYLQQLIKLAGVAAAESEFCLVLDADVIAVRPVSDGDLAPGGRAICQRDPADLHPTWVQNAGDALGVEPLGYTAGVTPSVLARDGVLLLADHATRNLVPRKAHYRMLSSLPYLRGRLSTWRSRLLGVLPWTEYQLYDTFMVRTGRFDRYHVYSEDPLLYGNSVWYAEEFEDWQPTVNAEPRHFFSVVQGWLDIPVDLIEARLVQSGLLM